MVILQALKQRLCRLHCLIIRHAQTELNPRKDAAKAQLPVLFTPCGSTGAALATNSFHQAQDYIWTLLLNTKLQTLIYI